MKQILLCILVRQEVLTAISFVLAAKVALAVNIQFIANEFYLTLVLGRFGVNTLLLREIRLCK